MNTAHIIASTYQSANHRRLEQAEAQHDRLAAQGFMLLEAAVLNTVAANVDDEDNLSISVYHLAQLAWLTPVQTARALDRLGKAPIPYLHVLRYYSGDGYPGKPTIHLNGRLLDSLTVLPSIPVPNEGFNLGGRL